MRRVGLLATRAGAVPGSFYPRHLDVHEQLAADLIEKASDHLVFARAPLASFADKWSQFYTGLQYLAIAEKAMMAQARANREAAERAA